MNKLSGINLACALVVIVLVTNIQADNKAYKCKDKKESCPDVYQPVCGYDRQTGTTSTYGNNCELSRSTCNTGGRICYAHDGPCNCPPCNCRYPQPSPVYESSASYQD